MKNFIRFKDFFQATIVADDKPENKDFLNLLLPSNSRKHRASHEDLVGLPKTLGVKIAATHAGKVTENNSVYLPDRMQTGTSSWIEPFPKPILLHHDKHDDPIGRVINAQYVDLSQGFRRDTGWIKRAEQIHDSANRPADGLIDAFLDGKLSLREAAEVVNHLLLVQDTNYTKDPSFEGLGYIELQASISDPDSIRKVLDKRYMTGSIGARSDAAICSVCKKDWVQDGFCDHQPGKKYEDQLCVVVAGNLLYDEYSYVNRPADVHSRNLEIFADGKVIDSIQLDDQGSAGKIPEVWFNFDDSITEFDKAKETTMNKETWLELLADKLSVPEDQSLEDFVVEVLLKLELSDEDKKNNDSLLALAEENFKTYLEGKEHAKQKEEEAQKAEDEKASQETDQEKEETLRILREELGEELYNEMLDESLQEEDILYAQMLADAKMGRVEGMTEDEVKAFLDAKLSSKKRKGLASSTFCGPDRSFPVPDCAHVTAARRLIGRYKGPGSKSAILACVARKAKRLGCDDDKKDEIGIYTPEYFDIFSDEEMLQLYNGLKKSLEEREIECDECREIRDTIEALQEENAKLKDQSNSASKQELEIVQNELKVALELKDQLQQELADATLENKKRRASNILALQVMAGQSFEDQETAIAELVAKEDDALTTIEDELRSSVDVAKMNALLQQGLAREPDGGVVVSNPTMRYTKEDATQNPKGADTSKVEITREFLEQVKADFIAIRVRDGRQAANAYLVGLMREGILPTDFPGIKED